MVKIEVELTDEQYEKVKQIREQGISVGQGIDMLFDVVDKLHEDYAGQKEHNDPFDATNKTKILEKEYGNQEKTYDVVLQERRHKIKWAKDFFKS